MAHTVDPDIAFASLLWAQTPSPGYARAVCHRLMGLPEEPTYDSQNALGLVNWAWQWAQDGFWSFTSGHKAAAALMATSAEGCRGDLILPGRALRITIPAGLLQAGRYDYRTFYLFSELQGEAAPAFSILTEGQAWRSLGHELRYDNSVGSLATSVEDLLFTDPHLAPGCDGVVDVPLKQRLLLLACRYTVGLLYTHQHTTHFKLRRHSVPRPPSVLGRQPPDHRSVFIGAPITVDARPQIREWLSEPGTRPHAPPSLQHLVRGHYKRQVIGKGRSGRKVIWVEPYWRGPEDAPILVHPRVVSPD